MAMTSSGVFNVSKVQNVNGIFPERILTGNPSPETITNIQVHPESKTITATIDGSAIGTLFTENKKDEVSKYEILKSLVSEFLYGELTKPALQAVFEQVILK